MKQKNLLPNFLSDFHDQKTIIKGFYTWLRMMDNQVENRGGRFDGVLRKRRTEMCDWISFHILVISFIDFLRSNGYTIYKTRGEQHEDILKVCNDLKELPVLWHGIENDIEPGKFPMPILGFTIDLLGRWTNWFKLMPKKVEAFYMSHKDGSK